MVVIVNPFFAAFGGKWEFFRVETLVPVVGGGWCFAALRAARGSRFYSNPGTYAAPDSAPSFATRQKKAKTRLNLRFKIPSFYWWLFFSCAPSVKSNL